MHGTPEQQELIHKIVDTIVREYRPEAVILFGSFAWGEPTRDSDVDLMIVKDGIEEPIKTKLWLRKLLIDMNGKIPMDLFLITKHKLRKMRENWSFLKLICNKGEIVYGRI